MTTMPGRTALTNGRTPGDAAGFTSGRPGTERTTPTGTFAAPTSTPGATFVATRRELVGHDRLLDTAEIARDVCVRAERTFIVLGLTRTRLRRIDGWIGRSGLVTHPATSDPCRPVVGSVCDRAYAAGLVRSIISALVDHVPTVPAAESVTLQAPGALRPSSLPDELAWLAVVSSARLGRDAEPDRVLLAAADGLLAADAGALGAPTLLRPIASHELARRLDTLVGRPPPSVAELLAEG